MHCFLAVLIYEDGNGWRCEEPRVYSATHPEIAYQLGLADGNEERYGRRFLGFSILDETDEDIEPIAQAKKGDARELVVPKQNLGAFCDPKWKGVPWDETELAEALREPPYLFEIERLSDITWHKYHHAYGIAADVGKDIRRLASTDPEIREQALWQLGESIYHQGTVYSATAVAVPFLIRLVCDERFRDRLPLCELLKEIAESSRAHPLLIQKAWISRNESYGEISKVSADEMAAQEIADVAAVHQAFLSSMDSIRYLAGSSDDHLSKIGASILEIIQAPQREFPACRRCRGSGECRCKRYGDDIPTCKRCAGTGKCHICNGSGNQEL